MRNKILHNYKGVTLIEALIYLGIFAAIFTVIIQYVLTTVQSNQRNEYRYDLASTTVLIHEHLNSSFFSSTSTDSVLSTFNSDQSVLHLQNNTGYYEYYVSNGVLQFNSGGIVEAITPNSIYVSRFYVTPIIDGEGNILAVEITIDISSNKDSTVTKTINSVYKH